MPSPRNDSDASARMAKATLSEAWTTMGAVAFGSTWCHAIAPAGGAERARGVHVLARRDAQHLAAHEPREGRRVDDASAISTPVRPAPSTAPSARASTSGGNDSTASISRISSPSTRPPA